MNIDKVTMDVRNIQNDERARVLAEVSAWLERQAEGDDEDGDDCLDRLLRWFDDCVRLGEFAPEEKP